jgi:hypothetical protein
MVSPASPHLAVVVKCTRTSILLVSQSVREQRNFESPSQSRFKRYVDVKLSSAKAWIEPNGQDKCCLSPLGKKRLALFG